MPCPYRCAASGGVDLAGGSEKVSGARAGVSDSHIGKSPTARADELSRPGRDHRDARSADAET